ncbi:MAG TPA: zinc-binding dehydrogenase [Gemmatimonadales bacterium]|nr:zinc-binding dehydrogenase [Gemmatimonadales bacterium]
MRALALTSAGGLDQMEVLELPDPGAPGPDEVLVRMHAAALNRLDLFVTEGLKGVEYHFPHIVGSDGAGVVAAVGRNVTAPVIGDRVMLNGGVSCGHCRFCRRGEESLCDSFQVLGEHRAGTIADFVTLPAVNVAPVPDGMTWAVAAAYPLATLTAWRMLTTRAALAQGETLFIWGAGGGVSQACIRIGRHLGATVIVAGSTDSKLVAATELGAHHVINYRSEDVAARMKEITGRRGADVVVDSVGEATWPTTLRIVSRSGRIVVCGATTGPNLAFDARRLFWHQWTIMGSTMGNRREWMEVVAHAAAGRLWPVPDMIVPLDRAVEAYRRLQGGEQSGKVVIEVAS